MTSTPLIGESRLYRGKSWGLFDLDDREDKKAKKRAEKRQLNDLVAVASWC